MQNNLLAVKEFEDIETTGNVTRLLKEVRGVSHQMENNASIYDAINEAKMKYYEYRQGDHDNNAKSSKKSRT